MRSLQRRLEQLEHAAQTTPEPNPLLQALPYLTDDELAELDHLLENDDPPARAHQIIHTGLERLRTPNEPRAVLGPLDPRA